MPAIAVRPASHTALIYFVVSVIAAGATAQSNPLTEQQSVFVDPANPIYSLVLPDGWRQVSPDLGRSMRRSMPADLAILLNRGRVDRFGAVDLWQKNGFNGRCLTIHTETDGEPELSAETLEQIQAKFKGRSDASSLNYTGEPGLATIGRDKHPAIECRLSITEDSGKGLSTSLVYIVPTGGRTLRFSFRARTEDFGAAEPMFRKIADSVALSSLPEGKKELSDKLQTPLIIGAVVGFLMLALYKLNRPGSR